jgi:hypothetical protein
MLELDTLTDPTKVKIFGKFVFEDQLNHEKRTTTKNYFKQGQKVLIVLSIYFVFLYQGWSKYPS